MGGIPVSLLIGGTPEKIDEYIRDLLREVMPEGGFILAPGTVMGLARETPIENIKALICAVEKYRKY